VNAYGVDFGDRQAFANLLRECGKIDGLERVRFMSPHPRDFTDDVIEAMAQTPNVMPHLHMPLQSGSDRVLQQMRRSYRSDRYLGILDRVRTSIPHAAITTDIIVGFPGETEEDFQATLDVCSTARFTAAYTYQYSKRPGTPAATMPDQISSEVVADRYTRLHNHQQAISLSVNQAAIGTHHKILVGDYEGRRDEAQARLTGRSEDFRLVHFDNKFVARPGDEVTVSITDASAHYLIGDPLSVRQTRGAEAHAARIAQPGPAATMLGIPTVKR
jgi:tRNA-2-methylthio-N6-dimethylallyladenosine synthase